jgi:diketogulonate reductase-like aldo/keto reductase
MNRMTENIKAADLVLTASDLSAIQKAASSLKAVGERYPEHIQKRIDR